MSTDDTGQLPEKVHFLRVQVAIETRTPTGPLPVSTPERIVILGPDDYGPVTGKLARSFNRVLPEGEYRDRDAILNRLEDIAYGREPSGLGAGTAESLRWRSAFEALHARLLRDLPGDGSELPPPEDQFWAEQLENLALFSAELYGRANRPEPGTVPGGADKTDGTAPLHYTLDGVRSVCGEGFKLRSGVELRLAFDPQDSQIDCAGCRLFLAGGRAGKGGE